MVRKGALVEPEAKSKILESRRIIKEPPRGVVIAFKVSAILNASLVLFLLATYIAQQSAYVKGEMALYSVYM